MRTGDLATYIDGDGNARTVEIQDVMRYTINGRRRVDYLVDVDDNTGRCVWLSSDEVTPCGDPGLSVERALIGWEFPDHDPWIDRHDHYER